MFEFVLEVFGEVILQVLGELIANFVARALADPLRPATERDPFYAFFGYIFFGLILGGLSLLVFPHYFITIPHLRVLNLIGSSLLAGLAISFIGRWKQRRGKRVIRLDTFAYGFVFAFSLALIRFSFCTSTHECPVISSTATIG
jgi:hypothetical protein